jgi:hypothetical protein
MKLFFHVGFLPKRKDPTTAGLFCWNELRFYIELANGVICLPLHPEISKVEVKAFFGLVAGRA